MALGISIEGRGVIANCDSLVNDTGGDGLGDWSEQGGGTMSLTTDVFLFGTSSIAGKYASKSGLQQFDLGAGNELDFSSGGAEEGQLIYIWVNLSTFGVLDTLANKGLALRVSSSSPGTTNYKDYTIAGQDGSNGWTGGWKCFVLDPNKTASAINGTPDLSAIRTIGVWIDTAASVRAESLFIDQIAVGSGVRVTGGTTNGWEEIVDYCTDYANRAWGAFQERDGIYYSLGKVYIGSSGQFSGTSFSDESRVIQYATSQYYESSAWKSTFPLSGSGIVIEDSATYATEFSDGIIVGTDNGRSGSVIIGNADQEVSFDLYGGNNLSSTTYFYGTTVKNVSGDISNGDTVDNKFLGTSIAGSGDIYLDDGMEVKNALFVDSDKLYQSGATLDSISVIAANTSAYTAFIESGNPEKISNSTFTFSTGHSIEITSESVTAFTFSNNTFANYGADETSSSAIFNNSGREIIINIIDNGDTPTIRNGTGASTTVNNTKTLSLTNLVDDTEVRIYSAGTITELDGQESVTGGTFVYAYSYVAGSFVDIVIFKEDYLFNEPDGRIKDFELPSGNSSIPINQSFDRNYSNP